MAHARNLQETLFDAKKNFAYHEYYYTMGRMHDLLEELGNIIQRHIDNGDTPRFDRDTSPDEGMDVAG